MLRPIHVNQKTISLIVNLLSLDLSRDLEDCLTLAS